MKLSEQNSVRHFTATAYVIDNARVLLVNHKKIKKWLPAGGHIEENEIPDHAVKREVKEETGLDVEIVRMDKHDNLVYPRSEILYLPFVMHLQNILDDHQHIDLQYICKIVGDNKTLSGSEECKWFTADEIKKLDNCPPEIKDLSMQAIKIVKSLK